MQRWRFGRGTQQTVIFCGSRGRHRPGAHEVSSDSHRRWNYSHYGFLDIYLRGKRQVLTEDAHSGLGLLVSLGFISREEDGPFLWPEDFEEMAKDIDQSETHLRLILVDEGFVGTNRTFFQETCDPYVPQFPVRFRIADACVSISAYVWRWKHFYW